MLFPVRHCLYDDATRPSILPFAVRLGSDDPGADGSRRPHAIATARARARRGSRVHGGDRRSETRQREENRQWSVLVEQTSWGLPGENLFETTSSNFTNFNEKHANIRDFVEFL